MISEYSDCRIHRETIKLQEEFKGLAKDFIGTRK